MLQRESVGGVTILRFDHGKAHALDVEFCGALDDALGKLAADETAKAVVLTGSGTIFCAGVDLLRLLEAGPDYVDTFVPMLARTFAGLFAFPRPVVAAINGHAIAGGCVLAAASDYRIMARGNGTIGVPELRVGVPFPLVAIEILRFATSTAHLQELVYRGKTYPVDEAYERGLVDDVVPPDRLLDHAVAVATRLASEPAARFRLTKRQLRQPTIERIARFSSSTDAEVVAEWKNETTMAAIRAYFATITHRR
ncbi:MAG TPA: enoyl-CoA hydratase/isomerase family protein [Gemmatimonadales bacterium]